MTTSPTGIYFSKYNHDSGNAEGWTKNFANYGDSGNRGALKVWKRGKVNLVWATFEITGESQYLERGSNDSTHFCVPVKPTNAQDYFYHDGNFSESGEMVVTINHAGPTGQAGEGGGGGGPGGSPATGFPSSLQFHAPFKHEQNGTPNPSGTLTGSNILFEGMAYGHAVDVKDQYWAKSNQFGIGTEFQELTKKENLGAADSLDIQWPQMSGIVDVRGTVAVSGNVTPYPAQTIGTTYNTSLGSESNWWYNLFTKNITGHNIVLEGAAGFNTMYAEDGEFLAVSGYAGNFVGANVNTIKTDLIEAYNSDIEFDTMGQEISVDANLVPYSDMIWSLGSYTNTWFDLYLAGTTIHMSGGNMTGWGAIALNDEGHLAVGIPRPTGINEASSGVLITGIDPNTFADYFAISGIGSTGSVVVKEHEGSIAIIPIGQEEVVLPITGLGGNTCIDLSLSGAGQTGTTNITVAPGGGIKIQIPGQTGDEGSAITTGTSSVEVSAPSGSFSSGISAGSIESNESGVNFCGTFKECIEDLGGWGYTGYTPGRTGYWQGSTIQNDTADRLELSFTGNSLKTLELNYHATGLTIRDAEPGRTMAIRISGGAAAVEAGSITAYQFLSGNDLNFLGVEPVALKIGKIGLLSITAFGTGDSSCFATWAETDYSAV
jgi:hypothetical protein